MVDPRGNLQFARLLPGAQRAFTMAELIVAIAATGVVACVGATVLGTRGEGLDAQYKLSQLAQAHACYANDWDNRQWTALPYDAGVNGATCNLFLMSVTCPNQQLLGRGSGSAIWGFFLGSIGRCAADGYPGSCDNWAAYTPLDFLIGSTGNFGAFRMPNMQGMREYLSKNWYAREWFSEDDPAFTAVSAQFNSPAEFTYPVSGLAEGIANPSYCLSPAAMLHQDVLRPLAEGGFQNPHAFAECYRAPSVTQCTYPSLKTRMCEYGWYRNAPSANLAFSAGRAANPATLFFDGSVQMVLMASAEYDDAIAREASASRDGLWSRDTTFGKDGYQPTGTVDGLHTGFHILTTGGILGRDLLQRDGGVQ